MKDKICPKCRGNGFLKCNVEEGRVSVVIQCDLCNSEERYMIKNFMIILITTLFLSHCSSVDLVNTGAALVWGMK